MLLADLFNTINPLLAAIGTVIGFPIAFIQVRKTIAEIRKIELETRSIKAKMEQEAGKSSSGRTPAKTNSNGVILTDPRLHALFLVLSNLIVTSIVLIIVNFALDVFLFDPLKSLVLVILSAILLGPIALEASRMQRNFRGEKPGGEEKQIRKSKAGKKDINNLKKG